MTPIEFAQGTDVRIRMAITTNAVPAVAVNITGATFLTKMGWEPESRSNDIDLAVTLTDAAGGIAYIELPDTITKTMVPRRVYTIDCMMTLAGVECLVYHQTFKVFFVRAIQ